MTPLNTVAQHDHSDRRHRCPTRHPDQTRVSEGIPEQALHGSPGHRQRRANEAAEQHPGYADGTQDGRLLGFKRPREADTDLRREDGHDLPWGDPDHTNTHRSQYDNAQERR